MSDIQKVQPIVEFKSQSDFREWLSAHFDKSDGIWLKMYKKDSGIPSVIYKEAVEEALCFGWIDGQAKPFDEKAYLQRFTPRRKKSPWSKINTEKVAVLIQQGKMHASGLLQIAQAKADGRWDRAYAPPSEIVVPEDFITELKKHPQAFAFFNSLNKTNTYSIAYNLATAVKPETRARRFEKYLKMMIEGKKIYK